MLQQRVSFVFQLRFAFFFTRSRRRLGFRYFNLHQFTVRTQPFGVFRASLFEKILFQLTDTKQTVTHQRASNNVTSVVRSAPSCRYPSVIFCPGAWASICCRKSWRLAIALPFTAVRKSPDAISATRNRNGPRWLDRPPIRLSTRGEFHHAQSVLLKSVAPR